jgi:hypothetical protein
MVGYGTASYSPTAWTLKGSNNGSSWTTLDTRSGISWGASEKKEFCFTNTTAYLYYQINITAGGVSGEVIINEIELFTNIPIQGIGYSTPANAGGNRVDVAQCYLKISNSIDNVECDHTPERCEEFNNRDNFGGFKYMPEIAVKEFWWGVKQKVWTGPY